MKSFADMLIYIDNGNRSVEGRDKGFAIVYSFGMPEKVSVFKKRNKCLISFNWLVIWVEHLAFLQDFPFLVVLVGFFLCLKNVATT